jgi:hypothetical protein
MEINESKPKKGNNIDRKALHDALVELREEHKTPLFTDSQTGLFEHTDNLDDALAVLDENIEIKNKLRR